MEHAFWHQRWKNSEIAFHEAAPNALLIENFSALALDGGSRMFLPLCGKTRDIQWLLSRNVHVIGAELSQIAVDQLFADLKLTPVKTVEGLLTRYRSPGLDVFLGDIFDATAEALGPIDCIYDRAALVALPNDMRPLYAAHLKEITGTAPQFLITYIYDQSAMAGPPFSVNLDEVHRLYGASYEISVLETREIPGGLKGKCAATENALVLRRREAK